MAVFSHQQRMTTILLAEFVGENAFLIINKGAFLGGYCLAGGNCVSEICIPLFCKTFENNFYVKINWTFCTRCFLRLFYSHLWLETNSFYNHDPIFLNQHLTSPNFRFLSLCLVYRRSKHAAFNEKQYISENIQEVGDVCKLTN